ncbi:UNVERIFIED_CONTAM: hypothetical protein GTU68_053748 [Idotea baltica]|nr:hypothetical protein [Idotea baltica]
MFPFRAKNLSLLQVYLVVENLL